MDFEELRSKLIDYYGGAIMAGYEVAMLNVVEIESATEEELLEIALEFGWDIATS